MELEVLVTSLDALLQRATEAGLDRPESAAVEAFCALVSECGDKGAHAAARVIAARLRSPQALLVLALLDICMKRCDGTFRAEIDKFRFLNEMIKLVSPKYYGNETAVAVQQKVLDLMQSWTAEYPKEAKIKDAFEMLKKQGVVRLNGPTSSKERKPENNTPASTPVTKPKDVIFGDEEKSKLLQKLLQSKNPDDIQAANRLIKTMVREDERRTEAVCRRFTDLQTVHNNVRLLDEVLDQYKPGISSAEDLEMINELHTACTRLRPIVFKLAADTQQNEEMLNLDMGSEGPKRLDKFWFLAKQFDEVLEASDELTQVTEKYNKIMFQRRHAHIKTVDRPKKSEDDSTLLDLMSVGTSDNNEQSSSNVNQLSELLSSTFSGKPNELLTSDFTDTSNILDTVTVLQPVAINNTQTENNGSQKEPKEKSKNKEMAELDALGQDLLKQSTSSFNKIPGFIDKSNSNLPLNKIIRSQLLDSKCDELNGTSSVSNNVSVENDKIKEKLLDIDFLLSKSSLNKESINNQTDDVMVDILSENNANEVIPNEEMANGESSLPISTPVESLPSPTSSLDFKNLSNIAIKLEEIKPSSPTPRIIYEEPGGLKVVMHFTKNKPRPDVTVLVISTTSHSSEKIEDFKFQATVPKPCKAHLLPASGNCFPAMNPFLPPAAITQVALVAIPQGFSAKMVFKFFISYTMQDDSFTEMGEVHDLPL